jgi:Phage tail tube protein
MPAPKTIGGSFTGLRWAKESTTIGVLPGSGVVWFVGEPNDYGDFGPEITTLARDPISGDRQSKKGMTVGLSATANFTTDFTQINVDSLMEGFFFAAYRTQAQLGGAGEVTGVSAGQYDAASGFDAFIAGLLVRGIGFDDSANNGLKLVTAATATTLSAAGLVAEALPPSAARVVEVGIEAGAGDIEFDVTGSLPAITSTVLDFTTLAWYPGMWVFIGDDLAGSAPSTAGNGGFKRIRSIAANRVEFDKSLETMANESPAGSIRIFYPTRGIHNEQPALIVRTTFTLERDLGAPDTDFPNVHQFEYVTGAVANTLSISIGTQDKVTMDVGFMGLDGVQRTAAQGPLAGSRPELEESDAFNTSSDFTIMRISPVQTSGATSAPLFGFMTEVGLEINNNAKQSNAIGSLPGIDITVGKFKVTGNVTAYFTDVDAIASVRNNANVTLDMALVKNNAGVVIDVPIVTLGDGRLKIEQDTEITIPVTLDASTGALVHPDLDYTLALFYFDYLPDLAE